MSVEAFPKTGWNFGFSGRAIPAPETLSPALRALLLGAVVCVVFFSRFGLNLGGFTLGLSLIAQYLIVVYLVVRGAARVAPGRAILLLLITGGAALSTVLNPGASATSLYLFIAIYLPFIFIAALASEGTEWTWLAERFSTLILVLAGCGILQFFLQFVFNPRWLFDFSYLIPDAIRAGGTFNTVISTGAADKANGFFMREPSAFSQLLGLGLVLEISVFKRIGRIGVMCLGLLLSYSGTGIIFVGIALLFPLTPKTLLRAAVVVALGYLAVFLLSQVVDLSYTLNRVGEVGSQGSSGFARFVAPGNLVANQFFSEIWTPFIGHGPGSILRTIAQVTRNFEVHDPTWAKLLFEYGLAGFLMMILLVGSAVASSKAPAEIRAGLFFGWLALGGLLLAPDMTCRLFLLCTLWPGVASRLSAARSSPVVPAYEVRRPAEVARSRPRARP